MTAQCTPAFQHYWISWWAACVSCVMCMQARQLAAPPVAEALTHVDAEGKAHMVDVSWVR